jgi:hypothetical protein
MLMAEGDLKCQIDLKFYFLHMRFCDCEDNYAVDTTFARLILVGHFIE